MSIDTASERNISQILSDVRQQSESDVCGTTGHTSSSGATGWSGDHSNAGGIESRASSSQTTEDWAWSSVTPPPTSSWGHQQSESSPQRMQGDRLGLTGPTSLTCHMEEETDRVILSADQSLSRQGAGVMYPTPTAYVSTDRDTKMKDELTAAQETNSMFKKMLVSDLVALWSTSVVHYFFR